jgi:hypothetical protein
VVAALSRRTCGEQKSNSGVSMIESRVESRAKIRAEQHGGKKSIVDLLE